MELEAEARKIAAEADLITAQKAAEGIRAKAEAEAEGIRQKGLAEAEGIDKKAEAQKKMSDASIVEMVMNTLPQIAKEVAAPLSNIDKITMYGNGDTTKLVKDIMINTNQIVDGIKETTGLDLSALLAGYLGNKCNNDN